MKTVPLSGLLFFTSLAAPVHAASFTWVPTGGGSWNSSANWTDGAGNGIPNAAGDQATIASLNAASTITLDGSQAVGTLQLNDSGNGITINVGTPTNSRLTFDNSGAGASLTAITSSTVTHFLGVGVDLNDNLTVQNSGTGGQLRIGSLAGLNLNANTLTVIGGGVNILSAISGVGGSIVKSGTGSATLSGTLANTYSGSTTVSLGTLQLSKQNSAIAIPGALIVSGAGSAVTIANSGNMISDSSSVSLTLGTLNLGGFTETIGSLSGASGTVSLGAGALTVGDSTSTSFSGTITGTGTLTKQGSGTLTLAGTAANTFSGLTTVNAGALTLGKTAGVNAIGGNLTVNAGGTVQLAAANQIPDTATMTLNGGTFAAANQSESINDLALSASSIITLSSDATASSLTISGSATHSAGVLTINGWDQSATRDQIFITGTASPAFLANVTFTGFSSGAMLSGTELTPVPEPETYALIAGLGLMAFAAYRRRRGAPVIPASS
jgi:autotransporter-associated beta strand protein